MQPLVDSASKLITMHLLVAVGLDLTLGDFRRVRDRPGVVTAGVLLPPLLLPPLAIALIELVAPSPVIAAGLLLTSYRKFCGTPPQNLLFALEATLGLIELEGAAAVRARHARLASAVRAAVQGWAEGGALALFARDAASRANAVTTIAVPPSLQVDELRAVARERFQVAIAGGLGPLTGRAFRIGHLGDQNEANVLGALAGVEAALRVLGVPAGDGIGRAVAALAGAAAGPGHMPA